MLYFFESFYVIDDDIDLCEEDTTDIKSALTGVLGVDHVLSRTNVVILSELLPNILGFDCDSDASGRRLRCRRYTLMIHQQQLVLIPMVMIIVVMIIPHFLIFYHLNQYLDQQ